MANHTSGPWHYNNGFIWSKRYRCICEVYPNIEITNDDISNARLIAAAPDLLAACEELLRESIAIATERGYRPDMFDTIRNGRAAIAKAKGE